MDACPLTKFDDGLQQLHEAEDDAVKWLESITTSYYSICEMNENVMNVEQQHVSADPAN